MRVPKKARRGFEGTSDWEKGHRSNLPRYCGIFKRKYLSPSILSVPLWTISKRLLLCTAAPSLVHLIWGDGAPVARHVSIATLPFGRVWFVGPIWMMGGGMSSTDVTWKTTKRRANISSGKMFFECARKPNIWSAMSSLCYQCVDLLRFLMVPWMAVSPRARDL